MSRSLASIAWFGLTALGAAVLLGSARPAVVQAAPDSDRPRFGRDVRPILADRCFQCHGPDANKRRAKLRLDLAEEATADRDGGAAIVPGDFAASEVWRRINSTDPAVRMPPPESNKPSLSPEQREVVRGWIAAGAEYEPHWAFVAPTRPPVPEGGHAGKARNAIDRFLLARLEKVGLSPSADAEKPVVLRRVFMDLTGLPPTPEELDEFLADARPDAYERWVDRLLTTEPYRTRYAERMAAPWMDQARYADTCGIHMDAGRQTWLWRDYVLNAYRENMPFDRFIREQIAGDLMPGTTEQQKIASGFNRNHVTTDEGGAISEEYLVEYAVDRTATTGSVFLGLTVGCARCHDHKFDPVTNEEFYKLYAYFNSIEEPGLYSQTTDANRAHEPFLRVPSAEQTAALARIGEESAALKKKQEERMPDEDQRYAEFLGELAGRAGVVWAPSRVVAATSGTTGGATLGPQPDGSVVASGENPKKDVHRITLRTDAKDLRVLMLEAIPETTAPEGKVGRAPNGNAVLTGVTVEAVSVAEPSRSKTVVLNWAWADFSQQNGDHEVTNVLANDPARGWAVGAHVRPGGRVVLMAAQEPFGFEGGTEVRVALHYESMYDYHTLARVRLSVGSLSDAGMELLPLAPGRWYVAGPFQPGPGNTLYEPIYGPEEGEEIAFDRDFGDQRWRFDEKLADERVVPLADGRNVSYVGRYVYSPTARAVEVSLGSDDGFRLFVNGEEIASRTVERAAAADQDKVPILLRAGRNTVVIKVVNTGGLAGYYYRPIESAELAGDLVAGLLSETARGGELGERLTRAWRSAFLPSYREATAGIAALEKQAAEINGRVPLTMVMKELTEQRSTFVLTRGQYDQPDKKRPVTRGVPAALGKLPDGASADRLGLAQWLTAPENPLVARVTVNRLWEQAFGTGLVRTSEDFGMQGEWPSHPELLDWLAVEFRESGWDVRHMMKLIVTSSAYRQSSNVRADLRERDPDNRLLAAYPRRRLTAEQIRDQALYVSGLLVEKLGGPSVKPYQPEGLWQEVAMPQSNTREYQRGMGTELWRRSLYTYWKRASPPPAMLTFDAPTREFCTIRRASTSTPLQALVLWNDEQFVEAARVLAQRTLGEPGDDAERLSRLFRRCATHPPQEREREVMARALTAFRERYGSAPEDAQALIKTGMAPVPDGVDSKELAAWTMVASAMLNLYEATTQE